MISTKSQVSVVSVDRVKGETCDQVDDLVAVEEPLQIRLQFKQQGQWQEESLAVTMRTPGNDFELAAGFLLAENVITGVDDIHTIRHCHTVKEEEQGNVVIVKLASQVSFDMQNLERHFMTTSSCGVCGKSAIDAITCNHGSLNQKSSQKVDIQTIQRLNDVLEKEQTVFRHTGGLHASALFNFDGELLLLREDIGRHNALDKVVGAALSKNLVPLQNTLVFLSGRVSYELVQKSVQAGIPIIIAVGAPSSLAVELAKEKGITLVGFLRDKRFNVYSHSSRIEKTG
ncbi:formate dehydrogenase accessory sulfurtransferase FdhD [Halalkalibaculum sp. DA3122]|uniref:formate dehydrogenase accessory sulfurtransferase FdhD n=1 Tax=Halalkalibaculum sp. DA3122 TaxID=3373607 RepID=UPI0037544DA9